MNQRYNSYTYDSRKNPGQNTSQMELMCIVLLDIQIVQLIYPRCNRHWA